MKRADWDRVKQLFQAALDRPTDERAEYLREQCGDDRTLQAEVESLLATHEQAGGFAARPELELLGALDSDSRLTAGGHVLHASDRLGACTRIRCEVSNINRRCTRGSCVGTARP